MITNSRGNNFSAKKEGDNNEGDTSNPSNTWLGLKDPRIVRVSRSCGGKDRHSKVHTSKGLRDRRIRLSVPTAIQLYDLQDRLGLNQPSKVVDWLINAAKHEIDELPPLQIPPGTFSQYPQSTTVSHEVNASKSSLASFVDENMEYVKDGSRVLLSSKEGFKIVSNTIGEDIQATLPKTTHWNSDSPLSSKGKEIRETKDHVGQESIEALSNVIPYNSYYHWDPSNPSLLHLGGHGHSSPQTEDQCNHNAVSMPSSSSLPSFFPAYVTNPVECEPTQINHFQMLRSSSQNLSSNSLTPSVYSINLPMRPFHFSVSPNLLHSQNSTGSQPDKGNTGSSTAFIPSFFQNNPKATHD